MEKLEIKGKVNTAICYVKVVEQDAIEQIRRMCDYEFTEGSQIRIMPDVHSGKGCTIGTTMTVVDKAVPNIVGVDIGCGMLTINIGKNPIDFEKLDAAAHYIPSGMNVWEGRKERFDLEALRCYRELKRTKWLERSLGTLGGGNHFIEVDEAAVDLNKGKETYFQQREEIIRTYKEQGRRNDIQAALGKISWAKRETTIPEDLCHLYGKYFEDYLHDVEICQRFAKRNREMIAEILMDKAGLAGTDAFHTIHNYIDTDEMILRKGAIAAHEGDRRE